MKLFNFAGAAAFAAGALAEDLLFFSGLTGDEITEAAALGYTTKTVSDAEWRAMTTADFAKYKAIVIGDQYCQADVDQLNVFADTKDVWGPAVSGNIIIIGTDPSFHSKHVLIDNSINFASSAKSLAGADQTGLYFSLSCYYDGKANSNIPALSYFGDFVVGGVPSCYNQAHIVGSSPALGSLSDDDLSGWSCSVHEAFSSYPSVGVNGFQALVIADGVINDGSQTFSDGHTGLPYIVSRGATPIGCGDGKWDASVGEECDDGNTADGDGCSKSCKCESGIAKGDGTCGLALTTTTTTATETSTTSTTATDTETTTTTATDTETTTTSTTATDTETTTTTATETETTSTTATDHVTETYRVTETFTTVSTILSTNVIDKTNTVTATAYTTLTSVVVTSYTAYPTWGSASKPHWMTTPYATPSATSVSCIGIEIIVSATETFQKPIYNTPIPTAPCYVCAMKDQGIPMDKGFITAVTTHGVDPVPATIKPCETCETISMTKTCPWEEKPTFTADHFTIFPPHDHSAMVQGKPVPTPAVSFVASIMAYTTDPSKWSIPTLSSAAVPAATGAGAWGSDGYAAPSTPGAAVPDATATWGGYSSSYPSAAPSGVSPATWGGSSNGTSDVWQYTGAAANTKVVGFGTGVMAVLAAALLL